MIYSNYLYIKTVRIIIQQVLRLELRSQITESICNGICDKGKRLNPLFFCFIQWVLREINKNLTDTSTTCAFVSRICRFCFLY